MKALCLVAFMCCLAVSMVLADHEEEKSMRDISEQIHRQLREIQVAKKAVLADHEEKSMRDISEQIHRQLREIQVAKKAVLADHEEKSLRDISEQIHRQEIQVVKKAAVAPLPALDSCDSSRCECEGGVIIGCRGCMIPDIAPGWKLNLVDAYDSKGCQDWYITEDKMVAEDKAVAPLPALDSCDSSRCNCEEVDGVMTLIGRCRGCMIPDIAPGWYLNLVDAYDSKGCQEWYITEDRKVAEDKKDVAPLPALDSCDSSRCNCEEVDGVMTLIGRCRGCMIPDIAPGYYLNLVDAYDSKGCQDWYITELQS